MSPRVIYMEFLILLLSTFLIFAASYDIFFTNVDQLSNVDMKECSTESPDKRLPVKKMWPMRYTLNLNVEPSYEIVRGYTIIVVMVENSTISRDISLHADGLNIFNKMIELRNVHPASEISYTLVGYRYCRVSQILDLRFDKNLVPGFYELTIHFITPFSSTRRGILKYQYNENSTFGKQIRLITTQLEPNGARRLFPCWDEPGVKTVFDITVKHPKDYTPFSNKPMIYYEDIKVFDTNLGSTHFDDTPSISASQVSVALLKSNLRSIEETEFSEVDQVWYRPEVQISKLDHALTMLKYIRTWHFLTNMQILRRRHYILFPNNILNTGCLGLIINREKDFMYDADFDFPGRKLDITKTITQRMARELFLGLITPAWWTDLWLGESLAKFYSHEDLMDKILSDSELMNFYTVKTLQPILHNDINLQMKSISSYNVRNANEIDEYLISPFYYDKGFALIRMLGHVLTQEKFEKVVKKYIKTYMLHSATADDFWTILQHAYNNEGYQYVNVKEVVDTWLTQRHYPHVHVNVHPHMNTTEIYIYQDAKANANRTIKWIVPINYCSNLKSDHPSYHVLWLNYTQPLIIPYFYPENLPIVSALQNGYYRVNYDRMTWLRISINLSFFDFKRINVFTRVQIIDDAYYFMMKHYITPETFWEIANYLKYETDYTAWYPMFNILSYIGSYWHYPKMSDFKSNTLQILGGLLQRLEYEEYTDEHEMQKALRLLATKWACKLGLAECRSAVNAKLITHLADPDKHKILPWWKDWIHCAGMMAADNHTWKELFKKYDDTKNPDIFKQLCCSEDEQIIAKYLKILVEYMLTNESLIHKELGNIFRDIVRKHISKEKILEVFGIYILRAGLQGGTIDLNTISVAIVNIYSHGELDLITEAIETDMKKLLNVSTLAAIDFLTQAQKQRITRYDNIYYILKDKEF